MEQRNSTPVTACCALPVAAREVPAGSYGLNIERRSFLDDGRVVEFTTSWYRGDIYDFVAELQTD